MSAYEFGVCITQSKTVLACGAKFDRLWADGEFITSELVEQWKVKEMTSLHRASTHEDYRGVQGGASGAAGAATAPAGAALCK